MQSTREGQIKGKLSYMAPEQLRGDSNVDRRVDVYAAGVVLWEGLVGKRLFEAENEGRLLTKILLEPVPSPQMFVPSLPNELNEIVMKALARNRDERFATARDFAQALEQVMHPANASEIGAWVEHLAGGELANRADRVSDIGESLRHPRRLGVDGRGDDLEWRRSDPAFTATRIRTRAHAIGNERRYERRRARRNQRKLRCFVVDERARPFVAQLAGRHLSAAHAIEMDRARHRGRCVLSPRRRNFGWRIFTHRTAAGPRGVERRRERNENAAARYRGASGNDASRGIRNGQRSTGSDRFSGSRRGTSSSDCHSASVRGSASAAASDRSAARCKKLQSAFHHRRFRDSAF